MAIPATTDVKREELLRVARLYGENLSRSAFGERGPDLKVTLADMEHFLRPLVEALAGDSWRFQRLSSRSGCPRRFPVPLVAASVRGRKRIEPCRGSTGLSPGPSRGVSARIVSGLFFPQRTVLKIDQHEYSPVVIDKIVFAGASSKSGEKAAKTLQKLAGLQVSAMTDLRITEQIGEELLPQSECQAAVHQRRELPATNEKPVEIACVAVDGGRIRTRASEQGGGVHDHAWKERKVAALWRMEGPTFDHDPHPEPPACFLDEQHVPKMVREIKRQRSEQHVRTPENSEKSGSNPGVEASLPNSSPKRQWPPQRVFRTCVATLKDVHQFGPLVAAEARRRGFYDASRQVFLGDGDHQNWTVHKLHFPHFTAITDFVHPVTYLFDAAGAVTSSWAAHWEQYSHWMTASWQGNIALVIAHLQEWQTRLGLPENDTPDNDPRQIIDKTLTYLRNNQLRRNYTKYRQQGLPITSCLVESLIKEINHRVKGTEQFWNRPSATEGESILQAVASLLSDGEPLTRHILSRPGCLFYRRSTAEKAAAAGRSS